MLGGFILGVVLSLIVIIVTLHLISEDMKRETSKTDWKDK